MKKEDRSHLRSQPDPGLWVCCYSNYPGAGPAMYNLATKVVDVSAGGICVLTVGRLRVGMFVTVELALPQVEARFKTSAVVRWSTTVESKGRVAHVAGLQFELLYHPEPEAGQKVRRPRKAMTPSSDEEPERAYKRFSPEDVKIVCVPRGVLRLLGLAPNTGRRLMDLSRGGAQIVCTRRLKPGRRVDLRLEFKRSEITIEAEGLVRWCRKDTSSVEPRYLAGVIFEKLPRGSDRRLLEVERAFIGS